ncbi:MAG: MFS transporter [Chloroflexota bacterium]
MLGLPSSLAYMFWSNFTFAFGMGLYSFLMPAYMLSLGATPVILGGFFSVMNLFSTLVLIPGGIWADRYDRRKLLVISWMMCLPVPFLWALARHWTHLILPYMLFFASTFSNAAMGAYVAGSSDPSEVGRNYSLTFAGFPLGAVVSPAIGGWIAATCGTRAVFYSAGVFFAVSTALICGIRPQRPAAHSQGQLSLRGMVTGIKSMMLWVCLAFAAVFALLSITLNFTTPYLQDVDSLPLTQIGIFSSIGAIGASLLTPLWGRLGDRIGFPKALSLGLTIFAGSLLLFVHSPLIPWIGLSFVLRGAGDGVRTLMGAQVGRMSSPEELGRHYAIYNVLTGVGSTVGPYVGGRLYDFGPRWPFTVTAGLAAAVAALSILMARRQPGTRSGLPVSPTVP